MTHTKTSTDMVCSFKEMLTEEYETAEGMTDEQTGALLEAISIIFEKCTTKQECTDAINRILQHLSVEEA